MRGNNRIFDTDTHLNDVAEIIEPYFSKRMYELLPDLDKFKVPKTKGMGGTVRTGEIEHTFELIDDSDDSSWSRSIPRVLGQAEPQSGSTRRHQRFRGTRLPTQGGQEYPDIRLVDMDEEGVDVQVIVPSTSIAKDGSSFWHGALGGEVVMEAIEALHRRLNDLCNSSPHRFKALLVVSPLDVERSAKEINRWGQSSWAVGIRPNLPIDYPIDHPDLNPLWAAAQENDLPLVHHSLNAGYPGYRDLWNNPFLGRTASHPWAAMRFVAAVTASGILDRFPELRFAILESGFGWLPFWARRMDEQLEYMGYGADDLKHRPSEYLCCGKFFAGIEMHEGPEMVRHVTETMGDGILMLGTDYPHSESYFPESVDRILDWKDAGLNDSALRKFLWENAARCFGEP